MSRRVRILIAVMRSGERQGVSMLLGSHSGFQVVGEAGERDRAVSLAGKLKPDVAVVDLLLPGIEYLGFLCELNKVSPRTRVVVIKLPQEESGVALGQSANRLIEAVRGATAPARLDRVPMPVATVELAESTGNSRPRTHLGELTLREREVVVMAAEGFSSSETALRLGISPRTVESHRMQAMRKLGVRRRAELVRYALVLGILPVERTQARKD